MLSLLQSPLRAAAAVVSHVAWLTAEGVLVTQLAHTLSCVGVTIAVAQVADALPITVGSPPATCALTLAWLLLAWWHIAVTALAALMTPVALFAEAEACGRVTSGGAAVTQAHLGAGGTPPALVASAVAVDRVTAAVTSTFAAILALIAPVGRMALAHTRSRVTTAVRVTQALLTTVWAPELRRAGCREHGLN